MTEITKGLYRDALHYYLKYAYPDDDMQYYSKWAWMVGGKFFEGDYSNHYPPSPNGFPREVRFGCYCSGNTKLRVYNDGFVFDTNHTGDDPETIEKVKYLKTIIESIWREKGIPVSGDTLTQISDCKHYSDGYCVIGDTTCPYTGTDTINKKEDEICNFVEDNIEG